MEIENKLLDVISEGLTKLEGMEAGTEEYKNVVNDVSRLIDRAVEIEKVNVEEKAKKDQLELDEKYKKEQIEIENEKLKIENKRLQSEMDSRMKQLEVDRTDRIINDCIKAFDILAMIGLAVWGTKASFEFEKEGTITTMMGRGFINKLLPKK